MASTYSSSLLLIFTIFSFLASISSTSSSSSSSSYVASSQLNFWSKNVKGTMPKSLLSKLSPLSNQNSSYFASLLSQKSFSLIDFSSFCTQANLACSVSNSSKYNEIQNGYNGYGTRLIENSKELDIHSFFRMSILEKGNYIELPNLHDQFPPRSFLPYEIASRISPKTDRSGKTFLDQELLHKLFPESFSSPATKNAIQTTLLYCSAPNLRGERKSCPKSLEEMIEFAGKVLGQKNSKITALTSKSETGSGKKLLIGNVKKLDTEKFVACHEVFFPFATYLCHLLSSTYLYSIDFVEDDVVSNDKIKINSVLAICHLDTSEWPKDHVAFKILKLSPGKGEACHFLTHIDLVWVHLLEGSKM